MNRKQMFRIIGIPAFFSLLVMPLDVQAGTLEELNLQKEGLESRKQELDEYSSGQQVKLDSLREKKKK